MNIRKSKVLQKIRNNETVFSMKLNLRDPAAAEIAAMSGFDCIWLDNEHVPNDLLALENMIRAAKIYDCDVMTRISRGGYSDLIRPLEADSTGVMIPHIMSLDDARKAVYYTKFHPIGRRPLDGGNADGKYGLVDGADYIKEANNERFTAIQIEDPEPMKVLEEICALSGIDMIFFGPADFSQGMGIPCEMSDERVISARKKVAKTARKYGKMAGTVGGVGNFEALIEEGFNFINLGADVIALCKYFGDIMTVLKK